MVKRPRRTRHFHDLGGCVGGPIPLGHLVYQDSPLFPSPPTAPPPVPSLSPCFPQVLTFSVTGCEGLQDQPSGPQGNGDLLGPVAEQGLAGRVQDPRGCSERRCPPGHPSLPAPALTAILVCITKAQGGAAGGEGLRALGPGPGEHREHAQPPRPKGTHLRWHQFKGLVSWLGRKAPWSNGTAPCAPLAASEAGCNPSIPASPRAGKIWGRRLWLCPLPTGASLKPASRPLTFW